MDFDECADVVNEFARERWLLRMSKARADGSLATWVSHFRDDMRCKISSKDHSDDWNLHLKVTFIDSQVFILKLVFEGSPSRDDKIIREVGAMQEVCRMSSLPVPRIHAWGLSAQNRLGLGPYILMDYVQGIRLSSLWRASPESNMIRSDIPEADLRRVYSQISKYMLQIAAFSPGIIGSFLPRTQHDESHIGPPLTYKMLMIEWLGHVKVGGARNKVCWSNQEFFNDTMMQNWERLFVQANSVKDEEDARLMYATHQEISIVLAQFFPHEDSIGFRLFSEVLSPWSMLVKSDTDLTITGIVDWQGAYIAPFQIFSSPPWWLILERPILFSRDEDVALYERHLDLFLDEMRKWESLVGLAHDFTDPQSSQKLPRSIHGAFDDNVDTFRLRLLCLNDAPKESPAIETAAGETQTAATCITESIHEGKTPKATYETPMPTAAAAVADRMPQVPNPKGRFLADVMQEHWDSGRFWFHELMHCRAISPTNVAWQKLKARYPYLETLSVMDQKAMDNLVEVKMKDIAKYQENLIQVKQGVESDYARHYEHVARWEEERKKQKAERAKEAVRQAREMMERAHAGRERQREAAQPRDTPRGPGPVDITRDDDRSAVTESDSSG
ncbi:hypothetical protein ANO11243_092560 [Dothideomycetidae sp. 11243]|nr:hypothetical protein ANO11243_092560 [fungal sp. No.11243]